MTLQAKDSTGTPSKYNNSDGATLAMLVHKPQLHGYGQTRQGVCFELEELNSLG